METAAQIGPSISIKGHVTAQEPLTIAGRVTGTIDVSGYRLVVTDSARVAADIVANTIVVGGNVKGKMLADERIVIRQTAQVQGDVCAPTLSLDEGAVVQGRLEVAGRRQPAAAA